MYALVKCVLSNNTPTNLLLPPIVLVTRYTPFYVPVNAYPTFMRNSTTFTIYDVFCIAVTN